MTGRRRNLSTLPKDSRTPGRQRARERWLRPDDAVALREAWRAESASGWSHPHDWWAPEVDALAETVCATGGPPEDCLPACEQLGRARAEAGVGLTEALDDLCALYRTLPAASPPLPVVRAFAEGWADAGMRRLHVISCEDPLTGLTSPEYLRTRLAEVYREAERRGVPVPDSHALLVAVSAPLPTDSPAARWQALLHRLAVGESMRAAFSGGETLAALSAGVAAGLVGRGPDLPPMVAALRDRLRGQPDVRPVRLWLERLPARLTEAYQLIADLTR